MSWPQFVPILVGTLLLFLLPGGLTLRALGLRGIAMWALAGPATVSIIATAAIVWPYLSLRFSPASVAIFTGVLTLAILLVRYGIAVFRTRPYTSGPSGAPGGHRFAGRVLPLSYENIRASCYVLAVLVPAVIITARFVTIIGSPENISQTYDNIYHLNAIRHIQMTGNGSSMTLGNLTEASQGFYPAAWHDVLALVVQLLGTSVPAAVTAGNIVISAVLWPLGCIYLVTRITGTRILPVLLTGAIAAAFSAFPYLMIDFGVLYPNLLSVAILPVALGIMVSGLRLGAIGLATLPAALQFLAVLPGLALAHPSTVVAVIAFGAPMMVAWLVNVTVAWRRKKSSGVAVIAALVAVAAYIVVGMIGWQLAVQPQAASGWDPRQTVSQALGEILGSGPQGTHISFLLLLLTLAGVATLAQEPRRWWLLGVFAVGSALFIVASAMPEGDLRHFWTGVWYNDAYRLAAILPTVTLPVAVLGGTRVLRTLGLWIESLHLTTTQFYQRALPLVRGLSNKGMAAAVIVIALGATTLLAQIGSLDTEQRLASERYRISDTSVLLSSDELALLERVPELVPPGDVVYGDPWNGSTLVYAVSGRETVSPHVVGARSEAELVLMSHMDEAGVNPAVCPAVKELNAYYALDFDDREVQGGQHVNTAMDNAESAPGLELIASEGEAKLYKVTACG
ncbi:DUF6541 family protein [Arthrobacter roseus]|uniref:DUF6541 family protein n=1 Tax=Arthrobacter roseus TaxID=136274 RepID=UPI0019644B7C|nr:DUF6541 family protein [Arthrobacter roseus]MBM7849092.1 hypothetical protein [Arthrobacter roseus]